MDFKKLLDSDWAKNAAIAIIGAALGAIALWLGLDVQAICQAALGM